MFANRNGFYYTLDRTNGKVIVAKPFVHDDLGEGDRTRRAPDAAAGPHARREGRRSRVPIITGGTNFWPPSFDPRTQTFFVNAREVVRDLLRLEARVQGGRALHGRRRSAGPSGDIPAYGALRAHRSVTGERKWEFRYLDPSTRGC